MQSDLGKDFGVVLVLLLGLLRLLLLGDEFMEGGVSVSWSLKLISIDWRMN